MRLSTLTTTASAYPAGSSLGAAADLLPLPCDAGFEQFRLFTQGTLSTNTIRTISPSSVVSYASTNTAAAVRQGSDLVVAATGGSDGSAAFGSTAAEFENGWTTWNSNGVTINAFTATVYRTYDDTLYNYGASTWNSVPGGAKTAATVAGMTAAQTTGAATLNLEKDATTSTTFSLRYTRTGPNNVAVSFIFSNVESYSSWFDATDIVTYWAGTPSVLDVSTTGTLTLKQNYHNPVRVQSYICAGTGVDSDGRPLSHADTYSANALVAAYLWADLSPGPEDVDLGTSPRLANVGQSDQYAPFYFLNNGVDPLLLHAVVRPKAGTYLRSAEFKIVLPDVTGLKSTDFEWVSESEWTVSANPNFEETGARPARVLKVVALHESTIPSTNAVYLGYWKATAAALADLPAGLNVPGFVTEIDAIQSVSSAGSNDPLTPAFAPADAVAGTGGFLVGQPTRRRLARGGYEFMGPLVFPPPRAARARSLQSCDPCANAADRVFGDANGDCALSVADALEIQKMIGTRASYADASNANGAIAVDPIHAAYACNFTRAQFNPLHDLIVDYDTPNDYRATVGAAHVGVTDVTHLLRAAAGNAIFIEPEVECVASLDALGHRPDVLVRTRVWGNDRGTPVTKTAIVNTNIDLHYDVLMVGDDATSNPSSTNVAVNVTNGTLVESRSVNSVAHTVPAASTYGYSRASGLSAHSAVLLSTYDAASQMWIARLQPHDYVGSVHYYVAIASGVKVSGAIAMPDGYAVWLGTGIAPFGADRFTPGDGIGFQSTYRPVIGDKRSALQHEAETCPVSYTHLTLPTILLV